MSQASIPLLWIAFLIEDVDEGTMSRYFVGTRGGCDYKVRVGKPVFDGRIPLSMASPQLLDD